MDFYINLVFSDNKCPLFTHLPSRFKDHKTDITSILYTNTAYCRVPERPKKWQVFEKRIVQGYQKLYAHVSTVKGDNTKKSNIKDTNTAFDEGPEAQPVEYFGQQFFPTSVG